MADDRDLEVKFDRTSDTWQTGESWSGHVQGLRRLHCRSSLADCGFCRQTKLSALLALHSTSWGCLNKGRTVSCPACDWRAGETMSFCSASGPACCGGPDRPSSLAITLPVSGDPLSLHWGRCTCCRDLVRWHQW